MTTMAKATRQNVPGQSGRPKSNAKKKALNITLTPEMFKRLDEFRVSGEFRIERSDVIEKALELYFREKKFPPKDA